MVALSYKRLLSTAVNTLAPLNFSKGINSTMNRRIPRVSSSLFLRGEDNSDEGNNSRTPERRFCRRRTRRPLYSGVAGAAAEAFLTCIETLAKVRIGLVAPFLTAFFKASLITAVNDHPTASESNEMDLARGEGQGEDESVHANVRCFSRAPIFPLWSLRAGPRG